MKKRSAAMVILVLTVFFVISFLTNILGPLIPDIIDSFQITLFLAGFLPFFFFAAYGLMSIPAGLLLERWGEKANLVTAFALALCGSLWFASMPRFAVALGSLFLIGAGMTMLQVAINPLLRVAGGEEHFAFYSVLGQLVFGGASFLSPMVYSELVTRLKGGATGDGWLIATLATRVPAAMPWVSLYWVSAAVTLLMLLTMASLRLPRVELKEDERTGGLEICRELLQNRMVYLYFFGIFAYVGLEQGVANWMSKFLATYHGLDPQVDGAKAVSHFWGLMTVGCLLGLVLLKLIDCRKVLIAFAGGAVVSLSAALLGPAAIAFLAFKAVGFCLSVMWSVIFSLALNSVPRHHGTFSGILCTGIVGGAFMPLIVGWLGDRLGLRIGMAFLYLPLLYILAIGVWAAPLVDNATLSPRQLLASISGRVRGLRGGARP